MRALPRMMCANLVGRSHVFAALCRELLELFCGDHAHASEPLHLRQTLALPIAQRVLGDARGAANVTHRPVALLTRGTNFRVPLRLWFGRGIPG